MLKIIILLITDTDVFNLSGYIYKKNIFYKRIIERFSIIQPFIKRICELEQIQS